MFKMMKTKNLLFLLAVTVSLYISLLFSPLPDQAAAATGVVTGSVVNIRAGAGTQYAVTGTLYKNTTLTIISQSGEWYQIQYGKTVGWVNQSLLSVAQAKPTTPSAAKTPIVILDGQQMQFEVPPIVENGRTLVPLRAIFEAMGAQVDWNNATQTVTATRGSTTVVLTIGSTSPTVNGQAWPLDVPAKTVNDRTLAPLRFIGEALGGTVTWDEAAYTVNMKSPAAAVDPNPLPVQVLEGVTLSSQRTADGVRIMMESAVKLDKTINKTTNQVSYVFANRQMQGTSSLQEYLGAAVLNASGSNQGDSAVVNIQLPSGVQYTTATENDGKREVLIIPNYIYDVSRKTFGSSGENITISTVTSMQYTSSTASNRLEVVFTNALVGSASANYNFNSPLISSMVLQPQGQTGTVLTITTTKAAKFSIGPNGDGTGLNILFIDQSEIQPRVPIVVLDAGHGGSDPGASGAYLAEKDVNLPVVLQAGQLLTAKGIKVVYTRSDDTNVSLMDRSNIANLYNASVFVSVHCNASTSSAPYGTETYCYFPLENPGLYLQKDERYNLALRLQQSLVASLGRADRGVKQSNLSVLRESVMPSALVELAFISNPTEEALLQQQQFRDLASQAIADAIGAYMNANVNLNNVRP